MLLGPGLGTLAGTLEPTALCAYRAHIATLMAVKCFAWDDAKNAKLRAERASGSRTSSSHIERGELLDILEHSNPDRYAGQRIFVVRREDYVYLVLFVEDEHTVLTQRAKSARRGPRSDENDHPEPEGHEAVPR